MKRDYAHPVVGRGVGTTPYQFLEREELERFFHHLYREAVDEGVRRMSAQRVERAMLVHPRWASKHGSASDGLASP